MSITLNSRINRTGPEVMYSDGFRTMIEDHLTYIQNHPSTDVVVIDPKSANKGDGDLVSVLQDYGTSAEYHWIIMRVNGYTSPSQYKTEHVELLVPSVDLINDLLRVYRVNLKQKK